MQSNPVSIRAKFFSARVKWLHFTRNAWQSPMPIFCGQKF